MGTWGKTINRSVGRVQKGGGEPRPWSGSTLFPMESKVARVDGGKKGKGWLNLLLQKDPTQNKGRQ